MNSLLQQHAVSFLGTADKALDTVTINRASRQVDIEDRNRDVYVSVYRNETEPNVLHVQFVEAGTLEEALADRPF